MKPTDKQINHAKNTLKAAGYVVNLFHETDVRSVAIDRCIRLSNDEFQEVISRLEWMDANIGISWESIDMIINDVYQERKE